MGPVRTCVGCRQRDQAGNLVRVARLEDGSLVLSRFAPGRGAWLCRDAETGSARSSCLEVAIRKGAFPRAFRAGVSPSAAAALRSTVARRANI